MISRIRIEYVSPNSAEIVKAILPDNVDLPRSMKISVKEGEGKVTVEIEMDVNTPKDVLTLRNTADEIISHMDLVEKVIGGVASSASGGGVKRKRGSP
ncbi:MAG: hypothetical protein MPF33_00995 [Candidatus Aramenus sp.]|nr:hypothetical protein [Candidatus Aramenus sp.]